MKIGFIGIGKLGKPCAEVMATKHHVETYDPIEESTCDSIEEVVKDKQLVFVAVPTPHARE